MRRIKLSNTSQPAAEQSPRSKDPFYDWAVYVDEDASTLNEIEAVTYFLHPTFPDPVQTVRDPATRFALKARGWGEFDIAARVRFKDGSVETTQYRLQLAAE
jgi:transcription initiation factor IIF auxiliary subunit